MNLNLACLAGISLFYSSLALGLDPSTEIIKLGGKGTLKAGSGEERSARTYQLGSEWGKQEVTTQVFNQSSPAFQRAAAAAVKIGGGTGFYLGMFAGKHVIATNHHVCSSATACTRGSVQFTWLGKRFKVTQHLGNWKEIDLALLTIEVPNESDAKIIEKVASNFDFDSSIESGQALVTVGYGGADNPSQRLVGNEDSDCKVFSLKDEFRFMDDPDTLNPSTYKTWSFANGCDISHGDSGSAMVDKVTGRPIGLIWTGSIPKTAEVQDSDNLEKIRLTNDPKIWTKLSYAVPAPKIQEFLVDKIQTGSLPSPAKEIVGQVIGKNGFFVAH